MAGRQPGGSRNGPFFGSPTGSQPWYQPEDPSRPFLLVRNCVLTHHKQRSVGFVGGYVSFDRVTPAPPETARTRSAPISDNIHCSPLLLIPPKFAHCLVWGFLRCPRFFLVESLLYAGRFHLDLSRFDYGFLPESCGFQSWLAYEFARRVCVCRWPPCGFVLQETFGGLEDQTFASVLRIPFRMTFNASVPSCWRSSSRTNSTKGAKRVSARRRSV